MTPQRPTPWCCRGPQTHSWSELHRLRVLSDTLHAFCANSCSYHNQCTCTYTATVSLHTLCHCLQWAQNKKGNFTVLDVVVDPYISQHLRPHQRDGVVFLYQCIMGMKDYGGKGAILA